MDITSALKSLHWLPISFRIQYKMALPVFMALNDKGPIYLQNLLSNYKKSYNSRSNKKKLLENPPRIAQLKLYGERSFLYGAPKVWKDVDISTKEAKSILSFKNLLKTGFFKEAFDC